MNSALSKRIGMMGLVAVLSIACGTQPKVDSVIKGFFSEINQNNFETAKANYLTAKFVNTLNAPGVSNTLLEERFKNVIGHIEAVEVVDTEVKGESASSSARLTMPWGAVWNGKVQLIKEGGQEWKISELGEFAAAGTGHISQAFRKCRLKDAAGMNADFQAALAENPKDASIYADWGWCYWFIGDLISAEAKLKESLRMYPKAAYPEAGRSPYMLLAFVYSQQGRIADAGAAIEKAVEGSPNNVELLEIASSYYVEEGGNLDR